MSQPASDPPVLDPTQLANLVKAFQQKNGQLDLPPETLQQLQAFAHLVPNLTHLPHPIPVSSFPLADPGPSSHPRGPPNLGQLSAAAAVQAPALAAPPPVHDADDLGKDSDDGDKPKSASGTASARTRGTRSAAMGSDEWARQRKDNHKEVERRRRGNINEGINELGRIVPNSSGEKAKGAILARAVQYIHHLKENEARNIEKWTLEKLLMDQAMGDLQAQLEEVRRLWEEERAARQRAESELDVLRGVPQSGVPAVPPRASSQPGQPDYRSRSRSVEQQDASCNAEPRSDAEARSDGDGNVEMLDGRPGKRPRVD